MLNTLLHKLFLTCKEATFLMELKEANALNFVQKIKLRIHLVLCSYCKIYNRNKELISRYFEKNIDKNLDKVNNEQIEKLKNKVLKHTTENKK